MKRNAVRILASLLLGVLLGAFAHPADARTRHHHTSHHHATHKKTSKMSAAKAHIRQAQIYLNDLNYNAGKPDGVLGSRTKAALKSFQRDHGLFATGKLTNETYKLLAQEARRTKGKGVAGKPDFYATHPDFYGHVDEAYSDPNQFNTPQPIPSRFGNLQIVGEQAEGGPRRYTIILNGQEVFQAENQPAPVLISKTFQLGDADLIVLTSYDTGNVTCSYKHYLLALHANSNHLYDLQNCTRNYEAHVADGNLLVSFPDDGGTGDMWRYENGLLVKL